MDYFEINKIDKRCPVCFSRENDVLLLHDGGGHYWCTHCSFTGTASEIHAAYHDLQKRFHGMLTRLTLEDQIKM